MKAINLADQMLRDRARGARGAAVDRARHARSLRRPAGPYHAQPQAIGGATPYRGKATLPPGLTLDPSGTIDWTVSTRPAASRSR